jgi:hypothetical protein
MQILAGVGAAEQGDFEQIASTVVSSPVSSVTFSSIPATYKHLQIRTMSKDSGTGTGFPNIVASLNGDTTYTNYRSHYLQGNGSTGGAGTVQASGYYCLIGNVVTSNAGRANMFSGSVIDILDYAQTSKYKTVRTLFGEDVNGSGEVGIVSSVWMDTDAVYSVAISLQAGTNFVQYSSFALYGING